MSFHDEMLAAMTNRLRANPTYLGYLDNDVISEEWRVVAYEEDENSDGFCETCYYSYDLIRYTLENKEGEQREVEERDTDLGTLLRELEQYSN